MNSLTKLWKARIIGKVFNVLYFDIIRILFNNIDGIYKFTITPPTGSCNPLLVLVNCIWPKNELYAFDTVFS